MLRTFLGLIALAALTLVIVGGVAFYAAPRDFRAELARIEPRSGPTAYLIYALDTDALQQAELERAAERMGDALRNADPPIRFSARGVAGDAARLRLVSMDDLPRARRALEAAANATRGAPDTLAYLERQDGWIEARLPFVVMRDSTRLAVAQSVQVIGRRLNPTGAQPILVSASGETRILIEARGEANSSRLRSLIGPTGQLTFNLVREAAPGDVEAGRIPAGAFLATSYAEGGAGAALVERQPRFTGERIVGASPARDPVTGRRVLGFQLDDEGARLLCRVTHEHVGAKLAVLIDDRVVAAPTIEGPVCGGAGRIAGEFSEAEAARLAALLRAGALPTPLILVEEGLRPAR